MADPGTVCLSGTAYDHVRDKLDYAFEDRGEQSLKNIARPVRVYRLAAVPGGYLTPGATDKTLRPALALPDKPSIAVLPFTNMSGDPEQEYFADGLTEDLITDLSRITGLFVIARNSSFTYKGKSVDVRQVAREMGVRFILEGSARRASGRVRINAQLIDAVGGGHLWVDRFDRDLADIFAVQDEVVGKIVSALAGKLSDVKLPTAKRPANLEAYECCVRGRLIYARSPEAGKTARLLFERAVTLDPQFAEAHMWLARSYVIAWVVFAEPTDPYRALAVTTASRAVALDPDDAAAHSTLGVIQLYEKQWAEAAREFETALRLNPNLAHAWSAMSELFVFKGEPARGIDCAKKGLRLDPISPFGAFYLGQAHYAARRYDDAIEMLRRGISHAASRRLLAASLAQFGRIDDARKEAKRFMQANPHFSVSYWSSNQPYRDEAARQHIVEGYLKAGLPE
jgi:TolB-like protein/cytochrome c-type biogenesis protein CcmH/NrfG